LKKVSGSPNRPLSSAGYGMRIRQALALREYKTGQRPTLKQIGVAVAQLTGRKTPYSAGTVSGWLEENSEPPLDVFLALGRWTGQGAGVIAFGPDARIKSEHLRAAEPTPPGYYRGDDEDEGAKKPRGA
jgi:hypothetical protein